MLHRFLPRPVRRVMTAVTFCSMLGIAAPAIPGVGGAVEAFADSVKSATGWGNDVGNSTSITPRYRKNLRSAVRDLGVRDERRTGYDRDLFPHWIDADADGCSTRYEVLIAEARRKPTVSAGCWLHGGTWSSYYDRGTTTNPSDYDVDHLVPLAEAWDSGAYEWNTDTRTRYANDLRDPRSLVAVTAASNRTKSDRDVTEWLPAYDQCRYIADWVAVKLRWSLTVDASEKTTLTRMAASCPRTKIKVRKAVVSADTTPSTAPTSGPVPTPTTGGPVRISAIAFDPAGPDTGDNLNEEWVEIVNTGHVTLDLGGWSVIDIGGTSYPLSSLPLGPGARVRVHSGTGTDNIGHRYAGWGYRWNNTGDTAWLADKAGALVSTCTYTAAAASPRTC